MCNASCRVACSFVDYSLISNPLFQKQPQFYALESSLLLLLPAPIGTSDAFAHQLSLEGVPYACLYVRASPCCLRGCGMLSTGTHSDTSRLNLKVALLRCDVKEGSYSKHMQAEGAAVCLFRSKHAGLSNHYHNHVLFQLSQGTMGFRRIMKEGKAEDVQGGKKIHMYVGKGGFELYFVSVVRFFFDAVRVLDHSGTQIPSWEPP